LKDNKSFPNKGDITEYFKNDAEPLQSANLADESDKVFFFNDKYKLMIPPQYRATQKAETRYKDYSNGYIVVEDAQKHRKLVSTETGKITDFPFDYQLRQNYTNGKILVVSDDKLATEPLGGISQNLGVVTTDGRLLTPCVNSGVTIADLCIAIMVRGV
jgi:hypothetical protein